MDTQELKTETQEDPIQSEQADKVSEALETESSETDSQEDQPTDPGQLLEAARQEAKDNLERFVRLSAEFDNYKKRTLREMAEFRKFANETMIKELLPVVDNLERAIDSCGTDDASASCVVEGVEMTLQSILKVLQQFEVTQVQSMEEPFDPTYHQAVMREETDEYPENTVIRELQKGYLLHDRLIRPAMVVVSAAKQTADTDSVEQKQDEQE